MKVLNLTGKPTSSCGFPPESRGGIFDQEKLAWFTATTLRFKVPVIADGGQLQSDDTSLYDPDHLQLNLTMYSVL